MAFLDRDFIHPSQKWTPLTHDGAFIHSTISQHVFPFFFHAEAGNSDVMGKSSIRKVFFFSFCLNGGYHMKRSDPLSIFRHFCSKHRIWWVPRFVAQKQKSVYFGLYQGTPRCVRKERRAGYYIFSSSATEVESKQLIQHAVLYRWVLCTVVHYLERGERRAQSLLLLICPPKRFGQSQEPLELRYTVKRPDETWSTHCTMANCRSAVWLHWCWTEIPRMLETYGRARLECWKSAIFCKNKTVQFFFFFCAVVLCIRHICSKNFARRKISKSLCSTNSNYQWHLIETFQSWFFFFNISIKILWEQITDGAI